MSKDIERIKDAIATINSQAEEFSCHAIRRGYDRYNGIMMYDLEREYQKFLGALLVGNIFDNPLHMTREFRLIKLNEFLALKEHKELPWYTKLKYWLQSL